MLHSQLFIYLSLSLSNRDCHAQFVLVLDFPFSSPQPPKKQLYIYTHIYIYIYGNIIIAVIIIIIIWWVKPRRRVRGNHQYARNAAIWRRSSAPSSTFSAAALPCSFAGTRGMTPTTTTNVFVFMFVFVFVFVFVFTSSSLLPSRPWLEEIKPFLLYGNFHCIISSGKDCFFFFGMSTKYSITYI